MVLDHFEENYTHTPEISFETVWLRIDHFRSRVRDSTNLSCMCRRFLQYHVIRIIHAPHCHLGETKVNQDRTPFLTICVDQHDIVTLDITMHQSIVVQMSYGTQQAMGNGDLVPFSTQHGSVINRIRQITLLVKRHSHGKTQSINACALLTEIFVIVTTTRRFFDIRHFNDILVSICSTKEAQHRNFSQCSYIHSSRTTATRRCILVVVFLLIVVFDKEL
mmetsp:Transcript_2281/g.3570  ORF Transcript_2281/g.3570 Transcript_2281/m.3570 type:complete len:220 (-) Transcript_2281:243-902(-)